MGRRKYILDGFLCGDVDAETAADKISRQRTCNDRVSRPWVVGFVEEEPENEVLFYVEKRDATTLLPLIIANVETNNIYRFG